MELQYISKFDLIIYLHKIFHSNVKISKKNIINIVKNTLKQEGLTNPKGRYSNGLKHG